MMPVFDVHTILQVLVTALAGGLIGLDRTAMGQVMISQPIVAGPLIGWLLGDVRAGLVIGASLELIWVLDMPIGTFVPADAAVTTVAATAIAAISGRGAADAPVIGFSLLLTTLMVPVTMVADHLMRMRNARIPELVLGGSGLPSEARVTGWHLAGMVAFFLKAFVLCIGMVPAGLVLMVPFLALPPAAHRAMALFIAFLPLLGAAAVTQKLSMRAVDRYVVVGCFLGAACVHLLKMPVPAAVLVSAGAGWAGVRFGRG